MSVGVFRTIVLVSWLTLVITLIQAILSPQDLPPLLAEYEAHTQKTALTSLDWIASVLAVAGLAASVSLLIFSNIGRWVYAVSMPAVYLLGFFGTDFFVSSSAQNALFAVEAMLTGMILCLCFFSDVSQNFTRSA
ncbi:hypothetical protein [Pseudoalteromonas rubra]|uniref:DUF4345 domain-containing protein n=1 Tax=Pseudoalteromonas rubra TaxID=43658 RepID=A0A5S3WZK4_9GAMM|nr:hypothetical protein [Pseudoalteromonas rubra]TMP37347.1 hypothetical protein CWB98_11505 [Pseudoalteromonas rubra]